MKYGIDASTLFNPNYSWFELEENWCYVNLYYTHNEKINGRQVMINLIMWPNYMSKTKITNEIKNIQVPTTFLSNCTRPGKSLLFPPSNLLNPKRKTRPTTDRQAHAEATYSRTFPRYFNARVPPARCTRATCACVLWRSCATRCSLRGPERFVAPWLK